MTMTSCVVRCLACCSLLAVFTRSQVTTPAFVAKTAWPDNYGRLVVDIDGDGAAELLRGHLLWSGIPGPTFSYRRLLGNGAWNDPPPLMSGAGPAVIHNVPIAAADVNGDGHIDVFVSRNDSTSLPAPWPDMLLIGDGQGGFVEGVGMLPSQSTPGLSYIGQSAVFLDIDADGDQDLMLVTSAGATLYVNSGSGFFADETAARIPGGAPVGHLLVVDADLDGDLDVVGAGTSTFLLQNNGSGVFYVFDQGVPGWCYDLFAVDLNGDGNEDVLAIYPGMQMALLATSNQAIMTQAPHLLPNQGTNNSSYSNAVLDFDGDGDLDCFIELNQWTQLWENTGTGMIDVTGRLPVVGSAGYHSIDVADHDLDGDMDLLLGGGPVSGAQVILSSTQREAVVTSAPIRGGTFAVDFYARQNQLMLVGLGLGVTSLNFPGLGHVYLDPGVSVFLRALTYTSTTRQSVAVAIPNLPWIAGMTIAMQGLDFNLASSDMQTTNCPFRMIQ